MNSGESTIKQYRNIINKQKTKLDYLKSMERNLSKRVRSYESELRALKEARSVFQKASKMTQNYLAKHLSSIVTKALRTIWTESNMSFLVEFVERRNTTECDMWIEEDGHRYSLFDGRGYGVVDVVSFSLKVAYIMLHSVDNVIIIDEPVRNLSKDKHEAFSLVTRELSRELGVQFIMSTHSKSIIAHADKSFYIENGRLCGKEENRY